MKWLELSVKAVPEFVEPLSQIFDRYGHGGAVVELEGGFNPDEGEAPPARGTVTIKTYLPVDSTSEERAHRIDAGVRLVSQLAPVSPLQQRVLDEEEWQNQWKKHFHVLHVGRRIVVCPTWQDYSPKDSEIVIALDPGMAFGTGHHPSTRACLEELEYLVRPGMDILDLGCGSGVLSIAAAKLGAKSALGIDIDPTAVKVARQNVRFNGLARSIRIAQGSLPHPMAGAGNWDVAVANISARAVSSMALELVSTIRPSGTIVASGIVEDNRDGVEQAFRAAGGALQHAVEDGEWVTLVVSGS